MAADDSWDDLICQRLLAYDDGLADAGTVLNAAPRDADLPDAVRTRVLRARQCINALARFGVS